MHMMDGTHLEIYFELNSVSMDSFWIPLMVLKVADFLHFWRVNGWYLGVKDENNAALEAIFWGGSFLL